MAWDFETDAQFQEQLDWVDTFVREAIEPIGLIWIKPTNPFDESNKALPSATTPPCEAAQWLRRHTPRSFKPAIVDW